MQIGETALFRRAMQILRALYGEDAEFREGQYEAIEAVMKSRRVLVVRKTGWGKSLIYFICTKLFRMQGRGVTFVVSPLLALMQNQAEAAEKLGLSCVSLNSTVPDKRAVLKEIAADKYDLVLVTPETLFGKEVQAALKEIRIGLFVIDEAHCISDWGHDFRLDYCNLKKVIPELPSNVPILATTATANERVVEDLEAQLGGSVHISRGPLTRESLFIRVYKMQSSALRYGWILENLKEGKLRGNGIIYCLTRMDCIHLADFLNANGVPAVSYFSRSDAKAEEINSRALEKFRKNEVKAIVATVKLGMGYDKGDIAFVIHYQMPRDIVTYYQQIGRAGRNLERAEVILLCGKEDDDVISYFIETAFPTQREMTAVMDLILENDGIGKAQIAAKLNLRNARLEKVLNFLENDGYASFDDGNYYATAKKFVYDAEHYDAITEIRRREAQKMREFTETKECYSKFIANCLDDFTAENCGHCANCAEDPLSGEVSLRYRMLASEYINGLTIEIVPRKMWPLTAQTERRRISHVNETGICLAKYGDAGYGELVRRDKYSAKKRFCDELVGKSREVLLPLIREKKIGHITCVPSLGSDLVEEFARRLAQSCGISFVPLLAKSPARPQKTMENSAHQCMNALNSFSVLPDVKMPPRVILADDIIDSGWTMTVCGYLLMQRGCEEVYPFALADSSHVEI